MRHLGLEGGKIALPRPDIEFLDGHSLSEAGPSPNDPAFRRANRDVHNGGRLLEREAGGYDERQGLALLRIQRGEGPKKFLALEMAFLLAVATQASRVGPVGILYHATVFPVGAVERVL